MNLRINALTVLTAVTAVLPAWAQQQKAYPFQCSGGKSFQAVFSAEQAIATIGTLKICNTLNSTISKPM